MKNLLLYLLLLFACTANAQTDIPVVQLPENQTLHFISPEPIQYVDISGKQLAGDLPLKNVLRIKQRDSSILFKDAIITIAGETFITQFHLVPGGVGVPAEIQIGPGDLRPLDIAGIGFSQNQLHLMALGLISRHPGKKAESIKAFGVTARLNHIYSLDDYIFMDLSYQNKTRVKYDIDEFRFSIDDKKVTKASNVQSVGIEPVYIFNKQPSFSKYYRNIFVFKKMTFPGNKIFHIGLNEKQVSGRTITLSVPYKDVLGADSLPD